MPLPLPPPVRSPSFRFVCVETARGGGGGGRGRERENSSYCSDSISLDPFRGERISRTNARAFRLLFCAPRSELSSESSRSTETSPATNLNVLFSIIPRVKYGKKKKSLLSTGVFFFFLLFRVCFKFRNWRLWYFDRVMISGRAFERYAYRIERFSKKVRNRFFPIVLRCRWK